MHNNRGWHQELMHVQRMADRHNRGIDRATIGTTITGPDIDYAKLAQSMGVHAADKLARIVDNVRNVLAIEFLCAAQGVDLRSPFRPNPALSAAHQAIRDKVPHLVEDRPVHLDIATVRSLIEGGEILGAIKQHFELE